MKLISDEDYKWFLKKKKDEQQDLYWQHQRIIAKPLTEERTRKPIKRYPYTKEIHEQIGIQIRRCKYQREFERQYTIWFAFKYLNYYGMPLKHLAIIECY